MLANVDTPKRILHMSHEPRSGKFLTLEWELRSGTYVKWLTMSPMFGNLVPLRRYGTCIHIEPTPIRNQGPH
jgi:hypothetical protein